jgi:hypothetical protein
MSPWSANSGLLKSVKLFWACMNVAASYSCRQEDFVQAAAEIRIVDSQNWVMPVIVLTIHMTLRVMAPISMDIQVD